MSNTPVEILRLSAVEPHPNADRLEIATVLGTQFVTQKGSLKAGDLVVYFPADVLIPAEIGEKLGVCEYLKYALFPGDTQKTKCRISAIRLRGVASFGFGLPLDGAVREFLGDRKREANEEATKLFQAVKYQPPIRFSGGDTVRQPGAFHTYTNIQHYYRYSTALLEGTPVRITEKLHGTNSRVGIVRDDGFQFMCGTHHRRVGGDIDKNRRSFYWEPLTDDMAEMLEFIATESQYDVIVFGEIFGRGVQKMDYGCDSVKGYRVFDISISGKYQDWSVIESYCDLYDIPTVPLLYQGPFRSELVDEFVSGPTTLADSNDISCKFKGREGIVITSLEETYSEKLQGRLILKAVSSDYHEAM